MKVAMCRWNDSSDVEPRAQPPVFKLIYLNHMLKHMNIYYYCTFFNINCSQVGYNIGTFGSCED